ncbi:MAG: hypothetical protein ACRCWN_02405 [Fusobacteriaceae bacterium]
MNFYEISFVGEEYIMLSICFFMGAFILGSFLIEKNIKEREIKAIVFLGFLIRFFLIIKDNFFEFITFSGGDGIAFNYEGYKYLMGGNYFPFPFIKMVVGPVYSMLQMQAPSFISSLNLLASTGTIIILYALIKQRAKWIFYEKLKLVMLIYSFSFFTVFLNVAFLRESILLFFSMVFLYYYFKFERTENYLHLMLSLLFLVLSAYLHSGMIFLGVIALYKFYFNSRGILKIFMGMFLLATVIVVLPYIQTLDYFKGKSLEGMVKSSKAAFEGDVPGSIYISQYNSIPQLIMGAPLRYFYFLFSPTPNFWRGLKDIFAFLMNSSIYIFFIYCIFKDYKKIKSQISHRDRILIESLMCGFFIATFIFAMGTTTAGTAIRHRDKFLPLLILIYVLVESGKVKQEKIRREKIKINSENRGEGI